MPHLPSNVEPTRFIKSAKDKSIHRHSKKEDKIHLFKPKEGGGFRKATREEGKSFRRGELRHNAMLKARNKYE